MRLPWLIVVIAAASSCSRAPIEVEARQVIDRSLHAKPTEVRVVDYPWGKGPQAVCGQVAGRRFVYRRNNLLVEGEMVESLFAQAHHDWCGAGSWPPP